MEHFRERPTAIMPKIPCVREWWFSMQNIFFWWGGLGMGTAVTRWVTWLDMEGFWVAPISSPKYLGTLHFSSRYLISPQTLHIPQYDCLCANFRADSSWNTRMSATKSPWRVLSVTLNLQEKVILAVPSQVFLQGIWTLLTHLLFSVLEPDNVMFS